MKRILTLFLVLTCAWIASGGPLDSGLPVGPSGAGGGTKFPLSPPLAVTPTSAEIATAGYSFALTATSPSSGAITYSSSDTDIATVSAAGLVTIGTTTGTADIIVSQAAVGEYFSAAQVTVPVVASWEYLPWDAYNVAIFFDGSDDYAVGSDTGIPSGTSPITVMLRYRDTVNTSNSGRYFFGLGGDDNYIAFRWATTDTIDFVSGPSIQKQEGYTRTTAWTHLAFVASSTLGGADFYINGALASSPSYLVGNASTALNRTLSDYGLTLGAHQNKTARAALSMCEVSIWNKILSQSEINFYKVSRLKGVESGLIRLYHCDEGSGTTIYDACGSGYDLTLTNGATWTTKL